jgi:eukaryotic-like serine/threonine-protein kinase
VIHRDVKPQNVMVVADPAAGVGFAKLADFGVAHVTSGDPLTRTGDVVGTLAYMAPEQAEGARVTSACDVYSLALTLYEAWTGTNPVRAGGPAATARRLGRPLPSLAALRRDLPIELCDVFDEALDPAPSRRPGPAALRAAMQAAEPELDDEGGLVEPATLRRVGLPSPTRRRGWMRRWRRSATPPGGRTPDGLLGRADGRFPRPGPRGLLGRADPLAAAPLPVRLAQRAAAGAAGGALMLAALESLGPEPPFSALAAAGTAALAIALLPRLGWLLAAAGVCLWLASPEADRPGAALLVAAAAAPLPVLLPRAGLLWSVPVLAPLLGTIALAPAFVGVAALAPSAWRRAGLGAAGFLWLALGEVMSGQSLLFGVPDGALARDSWEDSLAGAGSGALEPLLTTQALAPAAVWALFAAVLPLALRGRWLALDLIGAALWAAGLVAAHVALGDVLAADVALEQARGAVAGGAAAALVALSVSQVTSPAEGWRAPRATTA